MVPPTPLWVSTQWSLVQSQSRQSGNDKDDNEMIPKACTDFFTDEENTGNFQVEDRR